ncbi:N-6 DNA methylase [Candidatus Woesebacteria bacterium]|nr:N-6 DNA methylase [Candidatus Woesebacteria bacterium]
MNFAKRLDKRELTFVDICTGSGCIPFAFALEILKNPPKSLNKLTIFASDISKEALEVTKKNHKKLLKNIKSNIKVEIKIIESDLLDYFINRQIEIDILCANPPYVSDTDYEKLEEQIKDFEPEIALRSGKSSEKVIDKILEQVNKLPSSPKMIIIEGDDGKITEY